MARAMTVTVRKATTADASALLAEARGLELEHVTVHSSERAIPFYRRAGFDDGRAWLRWRPE